MDKAKTNVINPEELDNVGWMEGKEDEKQKNISYRQYTGYRTHTG
jgi:hypothetical protein